MDTELLLSKFIKLLPDGKYSVPMKLTVDKLGSSAILSFKVSLNESDMLPMQEDNGKEALDPLHCDRGQTTPGIKTNLP